MNERQTFQVLKYSEMIDRGLQFPDWQRLVNSAHVDKICSDLRTYINRHGHQPMLPGCLTLCVLGSPPTAWIMIDGQHRFLALKKLYEESRQDVSILCCFLAIDTENEAHHWFTVVNSNIPLLRIPPHQRLTVPNQVTTRIVSMFPRIFSTADRPRRPHLNAQELSSHLAQALGTVPGLSMLTADSIVSQLVEYNQVLLTYAPDKFYYPGDTADVVEKYLAAALKKGRCLLGMFKYYEFVKHCFQKQAPPVQGKARKAIPKRLRTEVWKKVNRDSLTGVCYVCHRSIHFDDFHCGHDIPECKGGATTLSNLQPICAACNLSCATQPLAEFKKAFV